MSQKLIFFGNERLATGVTTEVPVLKSLIQQGYEIVALVIAQGDIGQSRKQRPLEVVEIARQHDIPVLSPNSLREPEIASELASYGAVAGVLVAFGKMVPESIINLFPKGIINVHPSLLPKHRGSTPIESVIRLGEKETGVSLMALVAAMDAGPVYAQETVSLLGAETKQDLTDQLSALGAKMMIQHLPAILDGSLSGTEQDHNQATEDKRIAKTDSVLDFNKTAVELEREIRAYAGWPRSKTTIGTVDVIVTRAHALEEDGEPGTLRLHNKDLGIYCSKGVLMIDLLIPNGKKEMPIESFLAGYSPN